MLSLTCKTAIKAVVCLASSSGEKAGMKEIAGMIGASEHTVGKVLQVLVRDEIINSAKGPNGGFYITGKQKGQPIIKVIEAIDGLEVFDQCGLGLSKCSSTRPCPIHEEYKSIRNQFREMCRRKKISDLCDPVAEGLAYLVG